MECDEGGGAGGGGGGGYCYPSRPYFNHDANHLNHGDTHRNHDATCAANELENTTLHKQRRELQLLIDELQVTRST